MITTDVTEMLGLRQPIVLAPMCGMATGQMAGAVARAGGLGLIGVGSAMLFDAAWVREQFTQAKMHARSDAEGALGLGFITCFLTPSDPTFEASLALEPDVIFLAYGDDVAPYIEMSHAAGSKVICQVHNVSQAQSAATANADIIAVQGCDAGGHGQQHLSASITTLVPQVRDAIDPDIPLLAAGGIVDGRGLAAALVLGAGGAVIGSRFVVAEESKAADTFKARIIEAKTPDDGTVVSSSFDLLSGIDWPPEYRQGRALADSEAVTRFHRPIGAEQLHPSQQDKDWYKSSGYEARAVWVNNAVGLIDDEAPAEAITLEIATHARKLLDRF
ncbi:nitronate monooxygenase [Bauldia sp.]|uniref:nitronate monooxygenase n=1 Tax=Bauldia sp. TaxID=2575872 RepID=UPI003BAA6AC2